MELKLEDYIVISKANLQSLYGCKTYETLLNHETTVEAVTLASHAYDAGKLDAGLSLNFDNPKGRFLNSNLTIKQNK